MPNQPAAGKKMIGFRADKELSDAVDAFARENQIATRAEALEILIIEGLKLRGIVISREKSYEYRPDKTLQQKIYTLKMVGGVAAGEAISAPNKEELQVAREYPSDHGAYLVSGDSMTNPDGSGILDGSIIVARHLKDGTSPGNNRVYIFTVGGELTLKRFVRGKKGSPHKLESDNPDFPAVLPDAESYPIAEFVEVLACEMLA